MCTEIGYGIEEQEKNFFKFNNKAIHALAVQDDELTQFLKQLEQKNPNNGAYWGVSEDVSVRFIKR